MNKTVAIVVAMWMVCVGAFAQDQGADVAKPVLKPLDDYFVEGVFDYKTYSADNSAANAEDMPAKRAANEAVFRDVRITPYIRATRLVFAGYDTMRMTKDANAVLKYLVANLPEGGFGEARADAYVTAERARILMRQKRYTEAIPLLRDVQLAMSRDSEKRDVCAKLITCYEGLARNEDVLATALDALILYPDDMTPADAIAFYSPVQRIGARTMEPEEFWRIRLKIAGAYPPAGQDVGVWRQFVELLGVKQ